MVSGVRCCCWRLMPRKDYQKTIMSGIVSVIPVIPISLIGLMIACCRVCLIVFQSCMHDSFLHLQED